MRGQYTYNIIYVYKIYANIYRKHIKYIYKMFYKQNDIRSLTSQVLGNTNPSTDVTRKLNVNILQNVLSRMYLENILLSEYMFSLQTN